MITAKQNGPACHTGRYSCFGHRVFSLGELSDVISERLKKPSPDSYTANLTETTVGEKILEESQELVEAKNKEEVIWEAADLLYFILVKLAIKGISWADVLHELKRRRRSPKRPA